MPRRTIASTRVEAEPLDPAHGLTLFELGAFVQECMRADLPPATRIEVRGGIRNPRVVHIAAGLK